MIRASNVTPHPLRTWAGALKAFWPVGLCVLIMLPRLMSPQFGLMDDGVTISVAQEMADGDWSRVWEAGVGRSRPVYWLFNSAIYLLAGKHPLGFFLVNTLLFAVLTAGAIQIMRQGGAGYLQTCVAGVAFASAGPAVENFYTLSKAEPLQLLLLVLSLLLISRFRRPQLLGVRALWILGASAAVLLATLTKETSLVVVPIGIVWAAATWLWQRRWAYREAVIARLGYALATLLAAAAFVALRGAFTSQVLPEAGYAANYELNWTRLLSSVVRWSAWLIRDYAFLVPLAAFVLFEGIRSRSVPHPQLLLDASIWTVIWVVFFLPWVFAVEYYLLAAALGAAILTGIAVGVGLGVLKSPSKLNKAVAAVCLALAAAFFLVTQVNNISNMRLQLTVDKTNAEFADYLAAHLPSQSRILVNLDAENEYIGEVGLHLSTIRGRADMSVGPLRLETPEDSRDATQDYYILSPMMENQFLLSVRMGVFETQAKERNQQLRQVLGERIVRVYKVERRFRFLNIDLLGLAMNSSLARGICERFRYEKYCGSMAPVIDTRMLVYSWDVYKLLPDEG